MAPRRNSPDGTFLVFNTSQRTEDTQVARQVLTAGGRGERFDLEDPRDLARLREPMTALEGLRGLAVIDEIQRAPDLFPVLRVLADRRPLPARFLVLGSASPLRNWTRPRPRRPL